MIHISQIHKEVQRLPEFSLVFVNKEGVKTTISRCICTSWFSNGRTMNVKCLESGEIRKIRRVSIIEFNGQDVVL
jgi:phosphoribosyl-AMP cyclohydrolase